MSSDLDKMKANWLGRSGAAPGKRGALTGLMETRGQEIAGGTSD